MTGIGEAVTAVRGAYALARSAKDITDRVKLDAAVAEVLDKLGNAQSALLELQQQHFELIDENRQLKEEVNKTRRFDRYTLEETPLGGHILRLVPERAKEGEPDHAICPQCAEDGRLSYLQKNNYSYVCSSSSCKFNARHTELPPQGRWQ